VGGDLLQGNGGINNKLSGRGAFARGSTGREKPKAHQWEFLGQKRGGGKKKKQVERGQGGGFQCFLLESGGCTPHRGQRVQRVKFLTWGVKTQLVQKAGNPKRGVTTPERGKGDGGNNHTQIRGNKKKTKRFPVGGGFFHGGARFWFFGGGGGGGGVGSGEKKKRWGGGIKKTIQKNNPRRGGGGGGKTAPQPQPKTTDCFRGGGGGVLGNTPKKKTKKGGKREKRWGEKGGGFFFFMGGGGGTTGRGKCVVCSVWGGGGERKGGGRGGKFWLKVLGARHPKIKKKFPRGGRRGFLPGGWWGRGFSFLRRLRGGAFFGPGLNKWGVRGGKGGLGGQNKNRGVFGVTGGTRKTKSGPNEDNPGLKFCQGGGQMFCGWGGGGGWGGTQQENSIGNWGWRRVIFSLRKTKKSSVTGLCQVRLMEKKRKKTTIQKQTTKILVVGWGF